MRELCQHCIQCGPTKHSVKFLQRFLQKFRSMRKYILKDCWVWKKVSFASMALMESQIIPFLNREDEKNSLGLSGGKKFVAKVLVSTVFAFRISGKLWRLQGSMLNRKFFVSFQVWFDINLCKWVHKQGHLFRFSLPVCGIYFHKFLFSTVNEPECPSKCFINVFIYKFSTAFIWIAEGLWFAFKGQFLSPNLKTLFR